MLLALKLFLSNALTFFNVEKHDYRKWQERTTSSHALVHGITRSYCSVLCAGCLLLITWWVPRSWHLLWNTGVPSLSNCPTGLTKSGLKRASRSLKMVGTQHGPWAPENKRRVGNSETAPCWTISSRIYLQEYASIPLNKQQWCDNGSLQCCDLVIECVKYAMPTSKILCRTNATICKSPRSRQITASSNKSCLWSSNESPVIVKSSIAK